LIDGLESRAPSVAPVLAPWRPFLDVVLAYWLLSTAVGFFVGWRGPVLHASISAGALVFGSLLLLVTFAAAGIRRGWPAARAELRPMALRLTVIVGGAVLAASVFDGWRVSIQTVHPFAWDARLDAFDVALHGTRPWLLAQSAFAHPMARGWLPYVVEWVYSRGWFLANIVLLLAMALAPIGPRGQRVLVAHVLQYAVLGSFLAVVFSSGGPIFYGRIVGSPDPYASLLPALQRTFPANGVIGVVPFQAMLWASHVAGDPGLAAGITAFPSIHVSAAVLMALAAGSWRRWAGLVGWVLVALTLFGSVALGWHYAVDGYASILGMLVLWWVAGRMTELRLERAVNDRAESETTSG
jgi:hypothetical protein